MIVSYPGHYSYFLLLFLKKILVHVPFHPPFSSARIYHIVLKEPMGRKV